jgi:hypothetical protein
MLLEKKGIVSASSCQCMAAHAEQEQPMTTTCSITFTIGLAAMCARGLTAQTQETQTTTKTDIEVKRGKAVIVIGCVEQQSNGDYVLTPVRDDGPGPLEHSWYALVTDHDLSKHVGERVEIRGNAVTKRHGTIAMNAKTQTEVEMPTDQETRTKPEATSGSFELPLLSVRTMKTLSSCN